jgi:hypothetical protein
VRIADMNGDGIPDVVAIRPGRIEYWPHLGRGRFGDRVVLVPTAGSRLPRWPEDPSRVLLADVDGDGRLDIVTANAQHTLSILLGTGTGSFSLASTVALAAGASPVCVAAFDLNTDTFLDLATANYDGNSVSLLNRD